MGAYDFPLFQTLYEALGPKGSMKSLVNPYCFGMALSKPRAITFAITHDIPNNKVFENLVMSEQQESLAYTYLLGRDGGVPLIYTDLDTSRFKNRTGKPRWKEIWLEPSMKARIEFYHHMHGEPMTMRQATDDLLVFGRGNKGIVALNKSNREKSIKVSAQGVWKELLSGTIYTALSGNIEIKLRPMCGAMLVRHR